MPDKTKRQHITSDGKLKNPKYQDWVSVSLSYFFGGRGSLTAQEQARKPFRNNKKD